MVTSFMAKSPPWGARATRMRAFSAEGNSCRGGKHRRGAWTEGDCQASGLPIRTLYGPWLRPLSDLQTTHPFFPNQGKPTSVLTKPTISEEPLLLQTCCSRHEFLVESVSLLLFLSVTPVTFVGKVHSPINATLDPGGRRMVRSAPGVRPARWWRHVCEPCVEGTGTPRRGSQPMGRVHRKASLIPPTDNKGNHGALPQMPNKLPHSVLVFALGNTEVLIPNHGSHMSLNVD